jgi:hypothetical protein
MVSAMVSASAGGHDRARDQGRRREGAGGIMDEHDRGPAIGQCLEPGTHRCLPRGAAMGGWEDRKPFRGGRKERAIVPVDHGLDPVDLGVCREDRQALAQDRDIPQRAILLRQIASGAKAAPARDHDRRHVACHSDPA